jgi:hypothetical protein
MRVSCGNISFLILRKALKRPVSKDGRLPPWGGFHYTFGILCVVKIINDRIQYYIFESHKLIVAFYTKFQYKQFQI